MPDCRGGVPFFVMFGGRAMGSRRKFVLLGGFSVCLVHVFSLWKRRQLPFCVARVGPIFLERKRLSAWLQIAIILASGHRMAGFRRPRTVKGELADASPPGADLHSQWQIMHRYGFGFPSSALRPVGSSRAKTLSASKAGWCCTCTVNGRKCQRRQNVRTKRSGSCLWYTHRS